MKNKVLMLLAVVLVICSVFGSVFADDPNENEYLFNTESEAGDRKYEDVEDVPKIKSSGAQNQSGNPETQSVEETAQKQEIKVTAKPQEDKAPKAVPLPEDGIGAYKVDPETGVKEYLLFQTYDICMQWMGDDALCQSPYSCFWK